MIRESTNFILVFIDSLFFYRTHISPKKEQMEFFSFVSRRYLNYFKSKNLNGFYGSTFYFGCGYIDISIFHFQVLLDTVVIPISVSTSYVPTSLPSILGTKGHAASITIPDLGLHCKLHCKAVVAKYGNNTKTNMWQ